MDESKKVTDPVDCSHCQAQMELLKVKKYLGKWPIVLLAAGVFCCLFFGGAIIGVPLLLLGIYMLTAEETIRHCPNCGHYFKVLLIKPDAA